MKIAIILGCFSLFILGCIAEFPLVSSVPTPTPVRMATTQPTPKRVLTRAPELTVSKRVLKINELVTITAPINKGSVDAMMGWPNFNVRALDPGETQVKEIFSVSIGTNPWSLADKSEIVKFVSVEAQRDRMMLQLKAVKTGKVQIWINMSARFEWEDNGTRESYGGNLDYAPLTLQVIP